MDFGEASSQCQRVWSSFRLPEYSVPCERIHTVGCGVRLQADSHVRLRSTSPVRLKPDSTSIADLTNHGRDAAGTEGPGRRFRDFKEEARIDAEYERGRKGHRQRKRQRR